jgi:hypothetical protein
MTALVSGQNLGLVEGMDRCMRDLEVRRGYGWVARVLFRGGIERVCGEAVRRNRASREPIAFAVILALVSSPQASVAQTSSLPGQIRRQCDGRGDLQRGRPEKRPLLRWFSPQKLQITIPNISAIRLQKRVGMMG